MTASAWWCAHCGAERDISLAKCPECACVSLSSEPPAPPTASVPGGGATVQVAATSNFPPILTGNV